jgi:hypothetical protein
VGHRVDEENLNGDSRGGRPRSGRRHREAGHGVETESVGEPCHAMAEDEGRRAIESTKRT